MPLGLEVTLWAAADKLRGNLDAAVMIAQELTPTIRANVTVDWSARDSVRAELRLMVRRILKESGYPPDTQETAVNTVIEQAELLTERWAA